MMYPTAADILRCVDRTLEDACDPELPRMSVKSALATCRHMVRHVELRLRLERPILLADIRHTARLLEQIAAYLDGVHVAPAGMAQHIRIAIAQAPSLDDDTEDAMERLVDRANALREVLYTALSKLQQFDPGTRETVAYRDIRRLIREYIAFEIEQEARMVTPAFAGRGPRR